MTEQELQTENAHAHYDEAQKIATIIYSGELEASATVAVYGWLDALYERVGLGNVDGVIFDFSAVTAFVGDNLKIARRASSKMNMSKDTSRFPVALVVSTPEQEEILRGPMRISAENLRKRIVYSQQDALNFIHTWQPTRDK
ncbi:MAG: hypothetical protein EA396_01335 [Anaerolineaceae bacterium]|nr:MAG: hypothetical protein EA396_01335 [Anaerolineaceae bacterium]